jgi:hypothetical protein
VPATLVPPELAVASNCVLLRAVPTDTAAGVFHVIVGVALFTVIEFVAVADVAFVESLGMNVAFNVWVPALRIVPDAGE